MMTREEKIEIVRQARDVLYSQGNQSTFGLDALLHALEAEKPLAEGWAGPRRWRSRWDAQLGRLISIDFIPVWLNYQPKEGRRVAIYAREEGAL